MSESRKPLTAMALAALCVAWLAARPAAGQVDGLNMIGRQSHNQGLLVVPAPGQMTIDGKLDDWDWSGRIWVFADRDLRDRYSVEAAAMWDTEYLYLAAKWLDPTPMFNLVNSDFNPNDGWKSDAWQVRVNSDCIVHFTMWFHTPAKQPTFHVTYSASGIGGETFVLKGENGGDLGRGVQMAFQPTGNNGYIQEIRIPWNLVYRTVPAIEAGLVFRLGNEFLWGDVTGKTWPAHRYADNLQPGATSREFYWKANKVWGDAKLVATGNLPLRQYVGAEGKLQGTLPVRVELPAEAVRFTVAIDDEAGNRVRNLAGDLDPRDYTVAVTGDRRSVEVLWDCLADNGQPVPPGRYQARGLSRARLQAEYDMTFYNPGTPPWPTADGTGGWGSNHADPRGVARAGDRMIVYWAHSEGGHAIIALDAAGRKIWGELTGARELAADAESVYAVARLPRREHDDLFRLNAADGAYKPFILDGNERPLFLSISTLLGDEPPGDVVALASDGQRLAVAFAGNRVALLDATSAQLLDQFPVNNVQAVAFAANNQLYALAKGAVLRIDLANPQATQQLVPTPNLEQGTRLAVDSTGNLVVVDRGPDSQVKVFTPAGEAAYAVGRKGGRPWSGPFDEQAMMMMSSVAVDARDHIWVVEGWANPRRVSVWGRDGQLVRDYVGNTGYAGTDTWLDEDDPTLAYVGPVEMRLDREQRRYQVTRILWVPDPAKSEAFPLWRARHWYSNPHSLVSSASGQPIRYLYHNGVYSQWHAVFIDDGHQAKPVAAIASASYLQEAIPGLDLGATDKNAVVFWNDANQDGAVSRDECQVGDTFRLGAGWGNRMHADLSFMVGGAKRIAPTAFTAAGAPIYTPASVEDVGLKEDGDFVPVPNENLVLCLSRAGYPGPGRVVAFDPRDGSVAWSYPNPFPGVHGSHRATMPKPGLLIGPLKISGIADLGDPVGRIFAMRGNLGQDFFMTTDGLYVGALFQDGRLPSDSLPNAEEQLVGQSLDGFSEGGEPFNGWFGKQGDGKLRLLTSLARNGGLLVTVNGLDSLQRFGPLALDLDAATLAQANAANAARQVDAAGPKTYTITRLPAPPVIDGQADEWKNVPSLSIERQGAPERATAKLAYDATHLYALVQVSDPTPWLNQGKDPARLFKTGDAVDLQLGTGTGKNPAPGDQRLVFGKYGTQAVAVLMRPVEPTAPKEWQHVYSSPVGDQIFDRLQPLPDAQVKIVVDRAAYTLEAAIPLQTLGLKITPGQTCRGDLGFISSDATGLVNVARTYWSNQHTNLVNDEPLEAWFTPEQWGTFMFAN